MIQTETENNLSTAVAAYCDAPNDGLRCELPAGHRGKHAAEIEIDEDGKVASAVMWANPLGECEPEVVQKAKALVPNGDESALTLAIQLLSMDDDSLIEMAGAVKARVQRAVADWQRALEEEIGSDKTIVGLAETVMKNRIKERGAKMLPSDTYKVAIETSKTLDKRINILRQLEGKVPADRLRKALWVEGVDIKGVEPEQVAQIIAAGAKPVYNSHATHLRKLAADFGGEVKAIIDEGLVEVDGAERFIFEPLESAARNVTPLKAVR